MGLLLLGVAAFAVVSALAIYGYSCQWPKYSVSSSDYPWLRRLQDKRPLLEESADTWADELLQSMSLKEKVAQLSGDGGPLFLLRLAINVIVLKRFPNTYSGRNTRLNIPPFSFSDGPRGVVIGQSSCFPVAMARAASWDVELEARVGDAIAKELRAVGANYFGGLCINLLRHPAWGRAQECYGEDPHLTGAFGVALLESVQAHNVMVCAKHFALNSIENSRFYVDVRIDERSLHEVYLPHFKQCVDAGVASIMSAYNKLNGEYCGHNECLLNQILRQQWGFKGFVTSDWLWGIYESIKPVEAGMDVEMPYAQHFGKKLMSAVKQGRVDERLIDRNVKRVVRQKLAFIAREDTQTYTRELLGCESHRLLARDVSEQSMVLLKNSTSLLPLDRGQRCKIAVIGELAADENTGDHGSSRVSPTYVITPLEGLRAYLAQQPDAAGIELLFCDGADEQEVRRVAADADIVIVVAGCRYNDEGENLTSNRKPGGRFEIGIGGDRDDLSLPSDQISMIRTAAEHNDQCVVVLVGGSAIISSEWDNQVRAILMAWYAGMEGGHALARVLFGEINPSGKLPFSIPTSAEDLPVFDAFAQTVHYDYYHGYTHFDNNHALTPAYPFGFGLSYTHFDYLMASVDGNEMCEGDTITVGVQLRNCGETAGAEVVQMYISFRDVAARTGIRRHPKLLRGFKKLNIEPGEDASVAFKLSTRDLQRYDPQSKTWVLDRGNYQALLGGSSDETTLLAVDFTVK